MLSNEFLVGEASRIIVSVDSGRRSEGTAGAGDELVKEMHKKLSKNLQVWGLEV
jgi:hypothetical protein